MAAAMIAVKALSSIGFGPAAKLILESVLEEECTGNGALACLAKYEKNGESARGEGEEEMGGRRWEGERRANRI